MIWVGMVLGKNCIRKPREKNVDVTVVLTDSCVENAEEKPPVCRQHQQNGDVKIEVGMDQQVEKQSQCEDFLSRETLNMVMVGV